ncbi:hypothetical protein [Chryseobacterium sp. EO14]|uniref:hypothetical protein n=1 Tax=Chryseobacterium sp. EO14 TaxID=2950551 RepID=UPI00210891FF|nr:hypothetical protein [Chryseobacterium sp. EO14]MCQ4142441.1 hypothetical protein [Chryseobacterium sp. EO14]
MKIIKYDIFLLILAFFLTLNFNNFSAQTINVTTSNTGCLNSGIITATTTGIISPTFQLQLLDGTVVAPVAGNNSSFATTNLFNSLANGIYKVLVRDNVGNISTSNNITVSDGYTNMTLTANGISLPCIGTTKPLPVSITGGKPPYIYQIINTSNSTILETSSPTSAINFTFSSVPKGIYTVRVEDACGITVVTPVSVNDPSVTVDKLKTNGTNYYQSTPTNCNASYKIFVQGGFGNINGSTLSASERALFTWKIKFNGQYYGQDTNGDGFSDLNSNGYPLSSTFVGMPLGVTRDNIINNISTTKIVVFDECGNTKEFSTAYLKGFVSGSTNCINGSRVQSVINSGLLCLPVNFTFINTTNPSNTLNFTQTTDSQFFNGFTPGATYNFTYIDGNGNTNSNAFSTTQVIIPTNSSVLTFNNSSQANLNILGYGTIKVTPSSPNIDGSFNYTVTASSNPAVPIGTTGIGISGNSLPNVNPTDPPGYWPKGTYTIKVTTTCGTGNNTFTVAGYSASLSGNTITPICGGFDYVLHGNFDVFTDYEVVILSGPSDVGTTKDLLSASSSMVFSSLSYGNFTSGLRIKGGTTFIFIQNFSFGTSGGAITVNKDNTGGYVCNSGDTNGVLTILANSISPAPNNILEYRISLNGGATYGAWQTSNTFTGLTDTTYTFQIKDGCGFTVTDNAQVIAISNPQATANVATICELDDSIVIQLSVDTVNALYEWTGPGINTTNKNLKNPILNIADLGVGINNYTVTVTAPICSNSSTATTSITKFSSTKLQASSGISLDSRLGISTRGSLAWRDLVKNGALVLDSSNKGFVITRMKTSELPSGVNAVKGMLAYDTDQNCMKLYDGTAWKCIARICP